MGNGARLKDLLAEKGIKVSELARSTGIAPQTIYAIIKRDNTKLSTVYASKIADALYLDLPELLSYLDGEFSNLYGIPPEGSAKYDFDNIGNQAIIDAVHHMEKLNDLGKEEAAKRVEELTHIEKYKK